MRTLGRRIARVAALCLVAPGCGGGLHEASPAPPHVVLLIADDLGYGDVGFTGGDIATPNIDRLASRSLVLERFYAAPMCTPARAQLLTGRNAFDLGLLRNVKPRDDASLPASAPTLAERLRDHGYRTALVGKWHLGHAAPEHLPSARGFDASYGHLRGWIDYVTHEVDGITDWHRDGEALDEPGYSTDLIAAEARRVIEAHDASEPLLLVVTFNAPHTPLQLPPGADDALRTDARAVYGAMVEGLDRGVGEVLAALDGAGLADSSLVWFLSDNGANPKYGGDNGALRGGKYTCFEGALRVPACVSWPGRIAPGTSAEFMGTIDVAPTVLAAASAPPIADTDGVDVGASLREGAPAPARDFVFAVDHAKVQRRAILRPPHKWIEERRDDGSVARHLFDVAADPNEVRDLATERADLVESLTSAAPW